MEVVDFIAEFSATRELSLRLLEPSFHKVIYAREAGVDWRQLVASQLHEIGRDCRPEGLRLPDLRPGVPAAGRRRLSGQRGRPGGGVQDVD